MAYGRKTGGKQKGVTPRTKQLVWPINPTSKDFDNSKLIDNWEPSKANEFKSPKLIMLQNMWYFDKLGNDLAIKLDNFLSTFGPTKPSIGEMKQLTKLLEDLKATKLTAVTIADKVAPYCHQKLSPIEAKPEELENPFVIRAPKVIENSKSWQDYADIDGQWSNKFPEANQTIINSKVVENEINTMSEAERKVEISPADAWLKVVDTDKKIA